VLSRILGPDNARFLREFLRDPIHTAAIAPSSPALAEAMAAAVPSVGHPTVVELGTGAITGALAPSGVFSQFAYSWSRWAPPARAELAALRRHFSDVVISAPIRRNLPPAVVYYARGPVDRSRQEGG